MARKAKRAREELNAKPVQVLSRQELIAQHKLNVELFEKQRDACMGPNEIIKMKMLQKKITSELKSIKELEEISETTNLRELGSYISQLKMQVETNNIVKPSRLFPIDNTIKTTNIIKTKNVRAHEKRFALLSGSFLRPRQNLVDICLIHNVNRVIDKESSRRICPKCGSSLKFESHIFDIKDSDKDETVSPMTQSLTHMQNFGSQFEIGHPSANMETLEKMYLAYSKIHTLDHSKSMSARTVQFLKTIPDIPAIFKKAPERLTRELKADPIPEFTSNQINELLNQRLQLKISDEIDSETQKIKKSYNNLIFFKHLGLANGFDNCRIFANAKTQTVYNQRCCNLETMMLEHQANVGEKDKELWTLKPFS